MIDAQERGKSPLGGGRLKPGQGSDTAIEGSLEVLHGSVWVGLIIASLLAMNLLVRASPVSAAPIDDVIQHVQKLYAQGQITAALEYLNKQEANYPNWSIVLTKCRINRIYRTGNRYC